MPSPLTPDARRFFTLGAVSASIAVAAGAFGAHALRARLAPRLLEVFETAARYQMYHALALLAVAWLVDRAAGTPAERPATVAGWAFVVGTVLFAGSLYLMAFTGVGVLGAITPLGGVGFLVGWVSFALAAARTR